jgi:esterase/lipase superfamily enzyme
MAVSTLYRFPECFRVAIGLSGIYDPSLAADAGTPAQKLERLRRRSVTLGTGQGDYEQPEFSRRLSETLRNQGVPCRLKLWGPKSDHTWTTWREKLPSLLTEYLA